MSVQFCWHYLQTLLVTKEKYTTFQCIYYSRVEPILLCLSECRTVSNGSPQPLCYAQSLSHVQLFVTPWTVTSPDSSVHGIFQFVVVWPTKKIKGYRYKWWVDKVNSGVQRSGQRDSKKFRRRCQEVKEIIFQNRGFSSVKSVSAVYNERILTNF